MSKHIVRHICLLLTLLLAFQFGAVTASGAPSQLYKVDDIAAALGRTPEKVRNELQEMIDDGYFGVGAYIDASLGMLILDNKVLLVRTFMLLCYVSVSDGNGVADKENRASRCSSDMVIA